MYNKIKTVKKTVKNNFTRNMNYDRLIRQLRTYNHEVIQENKNQNGAYNKYHYEKPNPHSTNHSQMWSWRDIQSNRIQCKRAYIEQAWRSLYIRYKDSKNIKYNKGNSEYIARIVNRIHQYAKIEYCAYDEKISSAKISSNNSQRKMSVPVYTKNRINSEKVKLIL
jgi:predicted transport protein